jgi:hypothetical protein
MAKAARGDREALKTVAYQLGTAAAFGGMGGMPMDAPKLAGLASQALGGPAPSDYDDRFRRALVDSIGPTGANVIEEGLPSLAGPFAPVLGHRMGFDSGMIFGEPKSGSGADIGSFLFQNLSGASGSTITGWVDGLHQLEAGEYEKAGEGMLPGVTRDIAKGLRVATEGVTTPKGQMIHPGSFAAGLVQALGFQPAEIARAQQGRFELQKAIRAQAAVKTKGQLLKEKAAAARPSALGVNISPHNRALVQEYERAYQ